MAWAGKHLVDAVVAADADGALRWVGVELALVATLAAAQRGLALLRQVLGARLAVDVNVRILEKALTLELRHFEDPEFYDQLTRARRDASSRPIALLSESFQLLQNALTLAGYVALLVGFSALAVAGLALAALPATLAELRFSGLAFRLRNWRAPETRRLGYLEYVLANDAHAKEVKLFGLGPLLLERYRALAGRLYEEDRALALRRARWAFALSLLATFAFYGCYGWLAYLAATGALTLGELTLYAVAFRQGQQAFQAILTALGGMYEDNLYVSNLFRFLELPVEARAAPAASAATAPAPTASLEAAARTGIEPHRAARSAGAGIRFEDVGFQYPGAAAFTLRHLTLEIPAGERLAIVGENGSGKTTFIKLLTGLYTPTEGRITLDGRELRDWDRAELHRRFAVIFQDFNRYQLPLRENVGVGSVPHLQDEARVGRALESGGAAELARELPSGVETPLGRWFRLEGVELSGGQWQKVALARAFMREEADVLVLDEPTAALDARSEHAVFERVQALAKGRTTILISHRFPNVRTADRILVMERGRIVEQGTHEALLDADGRYASLFRLQAQGYRDEPAEQGASSVTDRPEPKG